MCVCVCVCVGGLKSSYNKVIFSKHCITNRWVWTARWTMLKNKLYLFTFYEIILVT